MTRVGIYPGSFDPLTLGHVAILRAGLHVCDRLVVAVGVHASKAPLLPAASRVALIEEVGSALAEEAGTELVVQTFDGLLVDLARSLDATILIRGLRDATDLDYEMQMAGMNGTMAPALQTVFIPARPETRHITATLVRQIVGMGGDITAFVPPPVAATLSANRKRESPGFVRFDPTKGP